jgi:hypothetical protein
MVVVGGTVVVVVGATVVVVVGATVVVVVVVAGAAVVVARRRSSVPVAQQRQQLRPTWPGRRERNDQRWRTQTQPQTRQKRTSASLWKSERSCRVATFHSRHRATK